MPERRRHVESQHVCELALDFRPDVFSFCMARVVVAVVMRGKFSPIP